MICSIRDLATANGVRLRFLFEDLFGFLRLRPFHLDAQFLTQNDRRVMIDAMCDRSHDAILHQDLDQINWAAANQGGQIAYRNIVIYNDFRDRSSRYCRVVRLFVFRHKIPLTSNQCQFLYLFFWAITGIVKFPIRQKRRPFLHS